MELRHPDHDGGISGVPMLIDSGADATLIPDSVVSSLGIVGTGERFPVMAFDGTMSDAEAVQVVLVFLGRRFWGRFLLTDSEIGVLGRDVLNHLRLLLDGPASSWEESPRTTGQG